MTKRICGTGLPRLLKRNQSSRGQALIEFSLVALTFFILVFALIDFSWLFFNQMMMQNAVREAARYASTGDHVTNGSTTLSRIASIESDPKSGRRRRDRHPKYRDTKRIGRSWQRWGTRRHGNRPGHLRRPAADIRARSFFPQQPVHFHGERYFQK